MKNIVYIPPLKIQGIKTKLVNTIKKNVILNDNTVWIEPFMGSGAVGFNIAPHNAVFADINPHIINFYNDIKHNKLTTYIVKSYLENEGEKLIKFDTEHYLKVRDRFNAEHSPLDFLFLNRACFNGMMRFNKSNNFNVPYCHKPNRFSKAYITKIVNQVAYVESKISNNNWTFLCQSFEKTISMATDNSFVYCDPPYIGRHVDYYDSWDEKSELALCNCLKKCNTKFMLSTWDYNDYRKNEYIEKMWDFCYKLPVEHFYYVGAKELNRNPMVEALLMNYKPNESSNTTKPFNIQLSLFD